MTTDLDHGTTGDPGTDRSLRQPVRGPAMRTYCATLARFTSSVQSTEQLLRNDEAGTREDAEQLELTTGTRLRGIERAAAAAAAGLEHSSTVRGRHGLPARPADDDEPLGLDRLRRPGSADLGVALTSLGRRRDALRLAEEEFERWQRDRDEESRRVMLIAVGAVGLVAAAVMAVAGTRTSAGVSLALLIVCTLAVLAAGLTVAAVRRLPDVCDGTGLARRPDGPALAKYAGKLGGGAALALVVANIAGGAF